MTAGRRFLAPCIAAGKAFRFMHAEQLPASRTGPFFRFVPDEQPDPGLLHGEEVFDHAHPVFRPVAFIQMTQQIAGKFVAAGTEPAVARPMRAVLDSAAGARLGLGAVILPAPGA